MNYCVIILIVSLALSSAQYYDPNGPGYINFNLWEKPLPLEDLDIFAWNLTDRLNLTLEDFAELSVLNLTFIDYTVTSNKSKWEPRYDNQRTPKEFSLCVGFEVTGPNCMAKYDSVILAPIFKSVLSSVPKSSSAKYLTVVVEYFKGGCPCHDYKVTDGCNNTLKKLMASLKERCLYEFFLIYGNE